MIPEARWLEGVLAEGDPPEPPWTERRTMRAVVENALGVRRPGCINATAWAAYRMKMGPGSNGHGMPIPYIALTLGIRSTQVKQHVQSVQYAIIDGRAYWDWPDRRETG